MQEIYSLSTPGRLKWKLGKQDREGEEAKQIATSKAHRSSFSLMPQGSCGGDLTPLSFPHSKKRRRGFPTLAPLIRWLRATPERWKFPGASCPWKCKKSPRTVLLLLKEAKTHWSWWKEAGSITQKRYKGIQGDLGRVWILSPTVSKTSSVTSSWKQLFGWLRLESRDSYHIKKPITFHGTVHCPIFFDNSDSK